MKPWDRQPQDLINNCQVVINPTPVGSLCCAQNDAGVRIRIRSVVVMRFQGSCGGQVVERLGEKEPSRHVNG